MRFRIDCLCEAWELDRIISLSKAVEVSSLSHDGWKRHYPDKLIRLSPRRIGVRLRDALMLAKPASGQT
jgi:hypothetical protein